MFLVSTQVRLRFNQCWVSSLIWRLQRNVSLTCFFNMGGNMPTSFSLVTSTNLGEFFNTFTTLVQNFKAISSTSPKLLNLTQDHHSKKVFFRSILYKIEVRIIFSHRNVRVTKLWSDDCIYNTIWVMWSDFADGVMDRNYDVITLFKITFISRRSRVTTFADIIKIITMFIKTIFKGSKKVKRFRNYILKCILYLYFLV